MRTDSRAAAQQASHYLPDERVEHWWDLWKFAVNQYTKQLRYPPGKEAWDIFVLYRSRARWDTAMPEPAFWMQHHNLDIGPKYEKERLEAELGQLQ